MCILWRHLFLQLARCFKNKICAEHTRCSKDKTERESAPFCFSAHTNKFDVRSAMDADYKIMIRMG